MSEQLIASIIKESIFAGLFVYLLKYVLETSKVREDKLMEHNEKTIEAIDKLTDKVDALGTTQNALSQKVDDGFDKVWTELEQIKNK